MEKPPKSIVQWKEHYGNNYAWLDKVVVDWGNKIQETFIAGLPDGTHVLALTEDGKIPLVHQYRVLGQHGWRYELPGGIIDAGESPESAAIREFEEEAGFVVKQLVPLITFLPSPVIKLRIHLFFATQLELGKHKREASEHEMDMKLVTPLDLEQMIQDGTIIDANTVMAFYLAKERGLLKSAS